MHMLCSMTGHPIKDIGDGIWDDGEWISWEYINQQLDEAPEASSESEAGNKNMRINYILIDYENVQPPSLANLDAEHFQVLLFLGSNQNKLSVDFAASIQRLGSRAEYIKVSGNGSNALDFHIAFHIGLLASKNPDAYFHIISKDTGFDPLIKHLKERKILASRSKDIADIPLFKATNAKTIPERVDVVIANLQGRGSSKPRTIKTLSSTVNSIFQKTLTEKEVQAVLKGLESAGIIQVNENKVTYNIPVTKA